MRLKKTLEYTPSNGSHLPSLDSIIYSSPSRSPSLNFPGCGWTPLRRYTKDRRTTCRACFSFHERHARCDCVVYVSSQVLPMFVRCRWVVVGCCCGSSCCVLTSRHLQRPWSS